MSLSRTVREDILERLGRVGIAARQAVESALMGQHRSVRRGLSVEFASHRPYQVGDDLRHLDWSVLARSDRYDVRVFEEETRLRATMVLDASGSMGYGGSGITKLDVARQLVAALAFLMIRQTDAVGLAIIDTEVREHLSVESTPAHLARIIDALEHCPCGGETALGPVLEALAMRLHRRGLVVVVSDGYDDPQSLLHALRLLRHRRQEVRIFLVQDPIEMTLPLQGTIAFQGLENEPAVMVDADRLRPHYRQAFAAHAHALAEGCHALGVLVETISTTEDLALSLGRALARNARSA